MRLKRCWKLCRTPASRLTRSSLQEQIEKIQGAGMGLCLLVSLDTSPKFFMQARCKIGVCIGLEMG